MERTANSALQQERSARTAAESARDAQCTEIKSLAAKVRELEMEKVTPRFLSSEFFLML